MPQTQAWRTSVSETGSWQSEGFPEESKLKYLDENGELLIEHVLGISRGELERDAKILSEAKRHAKSESTTYNKLLKLKSSVYDVLLKRVTELEKSTSENAASIQKELDTLRSKLDVLDWRETVLAFSESASGTINYAIEAMEKETMSENPDPKKITRLHNYLNAFDVLDQMASEISSNRNMATSMKAELEELNKLIQKKNAGKAKFKNYLIIRVADKLAEGSMKQDAESIMEFLETARFDITKPEMLTRFIGDSRDPVLALVAKQVNEQQQITRHNTIAKNREILERLEALEKERPQFAGSPEKLYEPILSKNAAGELTGSVITRNSAEYQKFALEYAGTEMEKFYDFFTERYKAENDKLPISYQMGNKLPGILKSKLEIVTTSDDKLDKATKLLYEGIKRSNMDSGRGELTDDAQKAIKKIPILYTQTFSKLDYDRRYNELEGAGLEEEEREKRARGEAKRDFNKVLSFDLASSLSAFGLMAENYHNMNEIIDVVEGAKYFVHSRNVMETNSSGDTLFSKLVGLKNAEVTKDGAESNSYQMLSDFIDMQVYGMAEDDLGEIFGLDINKVIKKVLHSNSTLQMSLNAMSAFSNKAVGEMNNLAEAAGKHNYTFSDYTKAGIEYNKELGAIMADTSRRSPESKVNLINEHYDILGDYRPHGASSAESSTAKRVWNSGSLFFLSSAGEHSMQSKVMIASMKHIETFNKDGELTGDLWDAHTTDGRKLVVKDGTYIKDKNTGELVKFTAEQQRKLSRNVQGLLRAIHGNYNQQTAAAWQKNGYLGLIGQYRKFMAETLSRHWAKENYNEFRDAEVKGIYKSFLPVMRALVKDIKTQQTLAGANWDKLSPIDKMNFNRTLVEAGFFVAMTMSMVAATLLLKDMDDDDKKKKATTQLMMLLSNRVMNEISFSAWPPNAWQILQTPMASMSLGTSIINLVEQAAPWNIDEVYVSGDRKGELKIIQDIKKVIPIWKQVSRFTPSGIKDQFQYLKMQ
jgi:hypothetical protein